MAWKLAFSNRRRLQAVDCTLQNSVCASSMAWNFILCSDVFHSLVSLSLVAADSTSVSFMTVAERSRWTAAAGSLNACVMCSWAPRPTSHTSHVLIQVMVAKTFRPKSGTTVQPSSMTGILLVGRQETISRANRDLWRLPAPGHMRAGSYAQG
jgi:hypothetical protein